MISAEIKNELETISQKIEYNTATVKDYMRYEELLKFGGLTHTYIFSYLRKAGFGSWEEFYHARQQKENRTDTEAKVVGGLIGLGLGILLLSLFSSND